jgi:hypothetical protein
MNRVSLQNRHDKNKAFEIGQARNSVNCPSSIAPILVPVISTLLTWIGRIEDRRYCAGYQSAFNPGCGPLSEDGIRLKSLLNSIDQAVFRSCVTSRQQECEQIKGPCVIRKRIAEICTSRIVGTKVFNGLLSHTHLYLKSVPVQDLPTCTS